METDKQPLLQRNIHDNAVCNEDGRRDTLHIHASGVYSSINSSASDSQTQAQVAATEETHVYKRRWYMLTVYSILACAQGAVWNTFGPIATTTSHAFGWSSATTALLENWGPITFLLTGFIFSWMMDAKGMKWSCISTGVLVALGTVVRCFSIETVAFTWLAHVGQFLNGCGGVVPMAGAPILSAAWFPPNERATATAIGISLNYMGVAFSYLIGPLLVPDGQSNNGTNQSDVSFLSNSVSIDEAGTGNHLPILLSNTSPSGNNTDQVERERHAIRLYMFYEAGFCVAVLALLLIYFPSKPPRPPCTSAAIRRDDFLRGLKHLLTRSQFWIVSLVYGVSLGALNGWSSVLDVMLEPFNIGEVEAGWIGFYSICAACLVSVVVARFADYVTRIMKWLVLFCYFIATGSFLVFSLITIDVIPASSALFYTTIIAGTTALNAAVPLIYELCSEMAYPTGEGTTNGVLSIINNFFCLVFLFLMMIPGIGSMWTNWTMAASSGICIPLLFLMREQYNRLEIDEHNPSLNTQLIVPPV